MKPFRNPERFLILVFLAVLWAVPLSQAVVELLRGERPQALALLDQKPTAANLRAYERDLEEASQAARWLRPWAQYAQFAWFKDAGEKALLGRAGWLFYKPGVECLTQRPNARRGQSSATEALAAIVSLRDQLAARGIRLLVVPAPNKESVYPEKVTRRAARQNGVVGGETRQVLSGLKAAGVDVVDLFELFARAKQERTPTALYLAQDSHWSPLGARLAASAVARRIREQGWIGAGDLEYEEKSAPVERRGDILRMLQVPALERRVPPEAIPCLQVVRRDNHQLYRDAAGSEVLVLGDSFLRIYERDEPGSAGFIAHLAKELKRPLASIVNDGGASTLVRQELCRRPALLAKAKLVIWEFVERDIQLGTEGWQVLQLPAMPGQKPAPRLSAGPDPASEASPGPGSSPPATGRLRVQLTWGYRSKPATPFLIKLATNDLAITALKPLDFEPGDVFESGECRTLAGGGDVDGLELALVYPEQTSPALKNFHPTWRYLLEHSEADTARRLGAGPGNRPDTRKLAIQMDEPGTRGFSLTVDQLLTHRAFWVPELDVFVAAGEQPVSFSEHASTLAPWRGKRVLDQVAAQPEASYEQFTARWEDLGSPAYQNPHSTWPGHIVCLAWDSALAKFGVDRGGNVWNDYGNPDHFQLGFDFGELSSELTGWWRGQKLADGLPLLTTRLEKGGVSYELEQFAYPLNGPPGERRGDLPMVLLQRLRLSDLTGQPQTVLLRLAHRREVARTNASLVVRSNGAGWAWHNTADQRVWLALEGHGVALASNVVQAGPWTTNFCTLAVSLPALGSRELVLKLPSPPAPSADLVALATLDFAAARAETVRFWSNYLAQGAQFVVPEEAVNTLFRANLWHALRLPRRHGGTGPDVKIDLPYSNFAYDQTGAPWPVNQAVYVDYMLYDLRGYHAVAAEELAAMYHHNQEPNGHVGGFGNWGVYTPGLLYAVAKHYLLSGDRASFAALLPQTLKALDWCLSEIRRAAKQPGPAAGLVLAPLNDLSHEPRAWAFNQAYLFAGVDLLAQALADIEHPRAAECRRAARELFQAVQRGYSQASALSPLVQLRDHTWMPYVPGDALSPRRRLDAWYPTEVDTGALHLPRLSALAANGPLTTYLLHDHEDNLFLGGWGMANEPVYNPQATAYLLRDEPKAAIRAFYSMLACAFSHSVFEPVEHRWGWGQYFGPPSTDGAWFELYRQMLIQERDDGSLWLCQAAPRKWLEDGKQIRVERAPTHFGPLALVVESRAAKGEIIATLAPPQRKPPSLLLLRLRHPAQNPMRSVTVNGRPWTDFDPQKEWVRIPNPLEPRYAVVARYRP